jgi:hypothetical protein
MFIYKFNDKAQNPEKEAQMQAVTAAQNLEKQFHSQKLQGELCRSLPLNSTSTSN